MTMTHLWGSHCPRSWYHLLLAQHGLSMAAIGAAMKKEKGCQSNVNLASILANHQFLPGLAKLTSSAPCWLKVCQAALPEGRRGICKDHVFNHIEATWWSSSRAWHNSCMESSSRAWHSASPGTWHLHRLALTNSSRQGFHRTEWSVSGHRSHLRLEGRSTWLPKISRDTRCKNIKNVYAICSEWQRHQTSQRRKSPSL